jgi:uncharacterized protein (TIGR02996 family)
MDQEAALLAAIAAHPEEDTPRLAYADWLDEHAADLPEPASARIRAEFIRVQCAVKKAETLPAEQQRPHVHLWRRQQELLDNHRRNLLGPLGDDVTYFDAIFDRGFVSELTIPASVFLRHTKSVRSLRPTPRIRVHRAEGPLLHELLDRPELGLVEALTVSVDEVDHHIGEDQASDLAACVYFTRLEVLELEGCHIGDAGLNLIAHSPNLPRLIELDLSGNAISDEGVHLLVTSPLWPRLRRLVLGGNPISDVGADLLVGAAGTSRLENLNLRFTGISPEVRPQLIGAYGGRLDLF